MLDLVVDIPVTYLHRPIIVMKNWHAMTVTYYLKEGSLNIKVIDKIDTEYYSKIQYMPQCHTVRGCHIGISAITNFMHIRYIRQYSMEIMMWNIRLPYEIYHSGISTDNIDMHNWIWRFYPICVWLLGLLDRPQIFHCTWSSTRSRSG